MKEAVREKGSARAMVPKRDTVTVMVTARVGRSEGKGDGTSKRWRGGRDDGHSNGSESKSVGNGSRDGARVR